MAKIVDNNTNAAAKSFIIPALVLYIEDTNKQFNH